MSLNLTSDPSQSSISSVDSRVSEQNPLHYRNRRIHSLNVTIPMSMNKRRRLLRIHRRLEKELVKNSTHPAPFSSVRINDKTGSMKANFLLIFAVMQCICGFVFPICDAFALTNNWSQFAINHKYYMEIFVMSEYVGAIIFLAYLQLLIHCYTDPEEKKVYQARLSDGRTVTWGELPAVTSNNSDTQSPQLFGDYTVEHSRPQDLRDAQRGLPPAERSRQNNCSSLVLKKPQQTSTELRPKLTWHKEGMNLYMRLGAVGFGLGVMIHEGFNLSSAWELEKPSCHSKLWIPLHLLRLVWLLWQTYFIFKYHKVILHVHRFTVRMAFYHLAVVNICHCLLVVIGEISEMLRHIQEENSNTGQHHSLSLLDSSIFDSIGRDDTELHNVPDVIADKVLHNISHVVTNTVKMVMTPVMNQTGSADNKCSSSLVQTLKPFLFPLAIEYSLVTGTLFYKMLQRVARNDVDLLPQMPTPSPLYRAYTGGSSYSVPSTPITNGTEVETGVNPAGFGCTKHVKYRQLLGCAVYLPIEYAEKAECQTDGSRENTNNPPCAPQPFRSTGQHSVNYCHRSHTGLFLGLMLFIASIIGIISSVSHRKITILNFIPHLYQYSKIFMLSVSMVACLLAIIQTNQLKFRRTKAGENFEYNLLGLGLVGCLTYHMLLFVPALEWIVHVMLYQSQGSTWETQQATQHGAITQSSDTWASVAILYIAKSTLEILQALLQFFFIVEASRRGPCCKNQALIKPGRSAIVFLMITNLALWLINTFEIRQAEHQLRLHKEYYGLRTWSVITCCFIPLIIFFRFHSTICLAQVWSTLYELRQP